jgi:SNF2 family DNA or RNA helicase
MEYGLIADLENILWTDRRYVSIEATTDGILFRSRRPGIFRPYLPDDWKKISSPLAIRNFGSDLAVLQQNDLVEPRGEDIFFTTDNIYRIVENDIALFKRVIRYSPLSLHIRSVGAPGQSEFEFSYSWYNGTHPVYPTIVGAFLGFRDKVYLLEQAQYESFRAVEEINRLDPQDRTREAVYRSIAKLHQNKEFADITLDSFLSKEIVIEPTQVGVGMHGDSDSAISLYPVFQGVDTDAMREVFMRQSRVDGVYDLPRQEGGRVRVIVSDDIQEVLKDLQAARYISGERAKKIERSPTVVLREGVNRAVLDDSFSPRVIGLTDTPISHFSASQGDARGWLSDPNGLFDGSKKSSKWAQNTGADSEDDFGQFVPTYRRLQILTNEDSVDFSEGQNLSARTNDSFPTPKLPKSLVSFRLNRVGENQPFELKRHQMVGIAWLQQLYVNRAAQRGGILADDMGLGKTLQLLAFLATVVDGNLGPAWPRTGQYNPILVVAPIILFDSWCQEIRSSFEPSPFGVPLVLYGKSLNDLRRADTSSGHELKLEESVLDLSAIRQHRLVITNYETVRNYQHSFGQIQWSVIIADEAQEIKSRNLTSEALKALKGYFKIASTGTPVENRLLDLWSIADFVQAGSLLGSANDFKRQYEIPMSDGDESVRRETADQLRAILGYNRPLGVILRRDKKSELTDLPPKVIKKIECALSAEEICLYDDLRRRAANVKARGGHLTLVANDLKQLFNHPRLYKRQSDTSDPAALISESSKIQALLSTLREIRARGEKVLIFSDRHAMQRILAEVVLYEFGFRPSVINSVSSDPQGKFGNSRTQVIKRFEEQDGFNVIILSPLCAGVGLTITGANNVVHYGRWWNPAIENQATDRAYRIGQTRPVTVYHLIAKDTTAKLYRSFDQILDDLLESKAALAADFLSGASQCELSDREVISAVLSGDVSSDNTAQVCRTWRDIVALDQDLFEDLCGIYLQKLGLTTVAASRCEIGSASILAWRKDELWIVGCYHNSDEDSLPLVNIVEDFLDDVKSYQQVSQTSKVVLAIISNCKFSIIERFKLKNSSVLLIEPHDIWKQISTNVPGYSDLFEYRSRRCQDRKEWLEKVQNMILDPQSREDSRGINV